MDIPYSSINVRRSLADGHRAIERDHRDRERDLAGVYRAGSSGAIIGGEVFGTCHRIAHARHVGIDKPVSESRRLMFAAGEANETIWENVLIEGWRGQVLRGQSVQKQGSWGVVMGSPDIVLADGEGNWQLILELKLVSALNTAIAREVEGKPDSSHVIQAATYAWLSNTPVALCYTSRTDFAVQFQSKKLGIKKVEPFVRIFYIAIKGGVVWYRDEFSQTEVATMLTVDGIREYYQLLHDMAHDRNLRGRPSAYDITGEPTPYDKCAYCPFSQACDSHENDWAVWLDYVRRECT